MVDGALVFDLFVAAAGGGGADSFRAGAQPVGLGPRVMQVKTETLGVCQSLPVPMSVDRTKC